MSSHRLFPTAKSLMLSPADTPPARDDLSVIRVVDRDSPEGQAILARRAANQAKRQLIEGMISSDDAARVATL
jgi:hypothetical protein